MNKQRRKLVAPIVVTVIFVLYYVLYFGLLITMLKGAWRYILGILPLALCALMVKVCIERISEIRKGEENDLSQY